MSQTVVIGVDFAKHVFHVHGSDETGRQVFSRRLRRSQVAAFFANFSPMSPLFSSIPSLKTCLELQLGSFARPKVLAGTGCR